MRDLLRTGVASLAVRFVLSAAERLNRPDAECATPATAPRSPLFDALPGLAAHLPWMPLGSFPTPVESLGTLDGESSEVRLWVKRDDLCSPLYGGNKVRKLEHILADVVGRRRNTLITVGGTGSNHALATAIHGARAGLAVDLVLYDQPVTPTVVDNLGAFLGAGARIHHAGSFIRTLRQATSLQRRRRAEGAAPYFIMVGGSSLLGSAGYVGAAFELRAQIAAGELPEPDLIFLPLGTGGTAAGLIVGLRLAGLRTRVVAVQVGLPFACNAHVLHRQTLEIANHLRRNGADFPPLRIRRTDFDVVTRFLGRGYGHATPAAESALRWANPFLTLETTYSAKALAACLDHCRQEQGPRNVLFWNTFNSAPLTPPGDWSGLPRSLEHLATFETN